MKRDLPPVEALRANLEGQFALPTAAADYLCALFKTIQGLDDWVDGDELARDDKDAAIWNAVAGLQLLPFYMQHAAMLLPLQANAFLKWKAADTAERAGQASPMAYAWRAGFYDIVLQCVLIVHGPHKAMAVAHEVMGLYGETLPDYLKEFEHA